MNRRENSEFKNFYVYEMVRKNIDAIRHNANLYQLMVIDSIVDSFYVGMKDDSHLESAVRYFIECADAIKTIPS